MSPFDILVVVVSFISLAIWIRGCIKNSASDCALAIILWVVASTVYFFLFSLTRTPYLTTSIFGAQFLTLLLFPPVLGSRFGRVIAIVVVSLAAVTAVIEHKYVSAGNALLVIEPHHIGKGWEAGS